MKKQEKTPYHTTTIYRGKSYVTRECITGRLFFWNRHRAWSTKEGPIIVLLDEKSERAYLTAGDDLATVAIVFIGNTPSDALCSYACQKELPMLILNKLAAEHDAKIAILDSRTATLFVDPDLDTLSRYARHLRFGIDATLSPMLSPRFEAIPLSEHLPAALHRAKMLSPTEHAQLSLPQHEDALFEALRTLGEESREYPLLFPVRVYNLQSEEI